MIRVGICTRFRYKQDRSAKPDKLSQPRADTYIKLRLVRDRFAPRIVHSYKLDQTH